uniref:Phage gp6-like head-tail connector protein n=1 Tax=Cereibacter sphaeroides (strain ATCC 17025 / ATH 2.4.3) TaxID=349102 RepID=A4WS98_CERS5
MAIVTVFELHDYLALTSDMFLADQPVLERKLAAAQNHIERLLGYRIEERFGRTDQEPVPPALVQAVLQLTAWWYENREAASEGAREIPFGVSEIVNEFREFTF